MKTVTWKIKESWIESAKAHPGEYTDYLFCRGWVKLGKLFPDVHNIYGIGGHFSGSYYYWHNFKRYSFGNVIQPFRNFFLRIDMGRYFITVSRPSPYHYNSVDIINMKGGNK